MKLRDIILSVVLVAISSCAKQEIDTTNGVPVDGVKINYSLPVSTVVETRTADKSADESLINSMSILVFEDKGGVADKFVEIRQATIYADGSALVKLTSSDGVKRIVRIVANADAIIAAAGDIFDPTTATWATISAALKVGTITVDGSGVPTSTLPTTPLPMFSDEIKLDKIEPGVTAITTSLKSGYAKVSLSSTDAKLVVTGIALHNAPAQGGSIFKTVPTLSTTRADYHKLPFTTAVNYILPTKVDDTHKVDLIVRGKYDGQTEDTYYRIVLSKPMPDGSRGLFNFLSNHHYVVTITEVGVQGYPTIEDALANEPSNVIIDIDVDFGDNNGMANNGQYCMKITNTTHEITGNGTNVEISKLTTDAPQTTKRSVEIISSVSDGEFLVKDVTLVADGTITVTTKDIGGGGVVRVTVGNLHQDITITNTDKSITLVDTDEKAFLTASSSTVAYALSTELSDKLGLTAEPTKVTLTRKDVLHTGLKYVGKMTVTDAAAKVSYTVPVSMEMYTVNVGGTLKLSTDKTRNYWSGGLGWATNHLTMTNIGSYVGMMVSVDPDHRDGMYFKWMTEWGGKSLNGPFSDGSGRTNASVGYNVWIDIPAGNIASNPKKYDPCLNAGAIPGISSGSVDWRKGYWRSPNRADVEAMRGGVALGTAGKLIKAGARDYVNGRLRLTGYSWLHNSSGVIINNLGAIHIDGEFTGDKCVVYRMDDDKYPDTEKVHGASVRCVRDNTRQ